MRPTASRVGRTTILVPFFCAASCTPRDPADAIAKELQAAVSSAATIQMTLASWLANRIPGPFAERTVDESVASLEEVARELATQPGGEAASRAVRDVRDAISPPGVERGGVEWARACLSDLRARTERLRAVADSVRRAAS